MHGLRHEAKITKSHGLLLGIIPILLLLVTVIQPGLASDPTVVDNLDYSFTATWNFEDMTNYTLANLTAANGEVNLTKTSDYWNQSTAADFETGPAVRPGTGRAPGEGSPSEPGLGARG